MSESNHQNNTKSVKDELPLKPKDVESAVMGDPQVNVNARTGIIKSVMDDPMSKLIFFVIMFAIIAFVVAFSFLE